MRFLLCCLIVVFFMFIDYNMYESDCTCPKDTTEQELLDMSKHFKELIKKKNNLISDLQKIICLAYGLARSTEENDGDISLVSLQRAYLSEALSNLCGVMEYED